jgi:translation elongation factor EF-Tu-like GTPase
MSTDPTFRMTVADVFEIPGLGTVAAGQIELGTINRYDQVWLHGTGGAVKTGVAFIHATGKGVTTATAGQTVGLVLRGLTVDRVQVGNLVSASGS